MKKNFKWMTALAVAVAATSCSNDDLMTGVENNAQNNGAIGVNTFVTGTTRGTALNSTEDLVEAENGFDLYAFLGDDESTQFMNEVEFAADETGAWDYADPAEMKFWSEANGSEITFHAVSPAATKLGNASYTANIAADAQTIDYTVPQSSADQVDLMYASTEAYTSDDETADHVKNGITLDFHHALSQIVFKVKTETELVYADLESVTLGGLYGQGQFDMAKGLAYRNDNTAEFPWIYTGTDGGDAERNASYNAEFTDAVIDINTTGYGTEDESTTVNTENGTALLDTESSLTNEDYALLLLPQNLSENIDTDELTIKCKVRYKRGEDDIVNILPSGTTQDEYAEVTVPLDTKWEPGYKYTYTIVFTADMGNPVKVQTVSVDEWNDGGETEVPETGEEDSEKSEDELTQAELNARLIANQFASANAASITADGVTFIENENWPTTNSEVNHSNYFSYKTLNENGLLTTAVSDENGNYWRVPTADEWNMLVIKDEVYSEVLGKTYNYTWTSNMTLKEGEETVIIDGQETTTSLTIGPAINVDAITRSISIEEQSIGALRFKGTKQHAAYLYSPVTLNESIYALEIRIKALKTDEEVEFQDICNAEYWNDEDCIKIVLPALNYSNGTGFESFYTTDKSAWYLTSTSTEVQGLGTAPMVHCFNATDGLFGSLQASSFSTANFPVRLIKCDADGNLVLE